MYRSTWRWQWRISAGGVMLLDADLGRSQYSVVLGLHPERDLSHVVRGSAHSNILASGPSGIMGGTCPSGFSRWRN